MRLCSRRLELQELSIRKIVIQPLHEGGIIESVCSKELETRTCANTEGVVEIDSVDM